MFNPTQIVIQAFIKELREAYVESYGVLEPTYPDIIAFVGRLALENIADSVGFHSADAFRRAFERRVGVTPSLFRRQAREENPAVGMASAMERQQSKSPPFYRRRLAA